MDFNLSARGRPEDVVGSIESQAKAITKGADKPTAKCVDAVVAGIKDYVDNFEEDTDAIAIQVSFKVYEL